jgi:hypothetical protein
MQEKIRTKPLKFRASRSAKQQNGSKRISGASLGMHPRYVHGSFPFKRRAQSFAQSAIIEAYPQSESVKTHPGRVTAAAKQIEAAMAARRQRG